MAQVVHELGKRLVALERIRLHRLAQRRVDPCRDVALLVAQVTNEGRVLQLGLRRARTHPGSLGASSEQIQRIGQEVASRYLQRVGDQTNPRYGRVLDVQRLPGTGSISVAVSEKGVAAQTVPEPSNRLSPTQVCP